MIFQVEVRIKIPDELKSYIVDDWEQITRNEHFNKLTYFFWLYFRLIILHVL